MNTRRRLPRSLVAAAVALPALALAVLPVTAQGDDFTVSGQMAMTGLAADTARDVYWGTTSPNVSELVALDATGKVSMKMTFAQPVTDVQAVSCRGGAVYVGDIGDAQKQRESIQVLRIASPGDGQRKASVYTFTYPDGPQDAAAMMVSPKGNIYIATRGDNPGLYRPSRTPYNGAEITLRRVADIPAGVTDGTFLADGARIALRGEAGVHVIDAYSFDAIALGQVPGQVPGDALTLSLDSRELMAGQGGAQPSVVAMPIPTGFQSATPKPSTPKPSVSKSAPATAAASTPSAVSTKPPSIFSGENRNTFVAIGIAGVVAVLAGLSTLIGRRPGPDED